MKFAEVVKHVLALSALAFCLMPLRLNAQPQDQAPALTQAAPPRSSSAEAGKKATPRPHRVITNDEIPSRTPGNSTPEIEARLARLNSCDRACFAQVFKDSQLAFRQRYNYPYPFSNKDDNAFEDAILSRMESLRRNPEWQTMLRNALIAQDVHCRQSSEEQQRLAEERASGKPVTAADIAAEEASRKNAAPVPNYGAATSAFIAYKFKIEKDFLLAAIVLYKYFEIVKTNCSSIASYE